MILTKESLGGIQADSPFRLVLTTVQARITGELKNTQAHENTQTSSIYRTIKLFSPENTLHYHSACAPGINVQRNIHIVRRRRSAHCALFEHSKAAVHIEELLNVNGCCHSCKRMRIAAKPFTIRKKAFSGA